jgi:hypothetical protein
VKFCSRASIAAHEPFAGTGVRGDAYVFLPVPKASWREQELNRRWAAPAELQAIREARAAGIVTRLYNPPPVADGAEPPAILVHVGPAGAPAGLEPLLAAFGGRWPRDLSGRPRLAICTQGTRDRCCAKWGFAAFQAARRLFEAGRSPFAPIESSHLGGDRFAATGVFFPSGSMYAHLDAVDLAALCGSEAAGRLEPAAYRGRVYDPQLAQLARAALAAHGMFNDAAAPIAVERRAPDEAEARAGGRRYRLRLRAREVEFFGDCAHLAVERLSRGRRMVVERLDAIA